MGSALVALAATISSCSGDTPSRTDVIGAMTNSKVPARYDALAADSASLAAEASAWCEGDRTDPSALLVQVAAVRDDWAALRPFRFGPAMDRRSYGIIDYPAVPEEITALALGDAELTATSLRERIGADQRGLGAIEVLAAPASGVADDRACDYLQASADLVAEETAALAAEWQTYGPSVSADEATANAALADLVSETLFGLVVAGSDDPEAAGQLAGARMAMLGDGSEDGDLGISPLLDDDVITQLTADFDALAADPSADTAMAVERTIRTNVVGDLGITVNFSDADGDG